MNRSRILTLTVATLVALIAACDTGLSTDPSAEPSDETPVVTEPSGAYAEYNATLPSWSQFAPREQASDAPVPGTESTFNQLAGGLVHRCTSEQRTLTANPESLVTFNPDVAALWVGSLLQGKHYVDGLGSLAELPVRERAPIVIYLDKLTRNATRTVETPTAATVQQAISDLVRELHESDERIASNFYFKQEESFSAEQTALSLGLSASYGAGAISAGFDRERSADETRVTAHFVQELFTVAMVSPQTPAAMFTDVFTQEKLDEQVQLGRIGPNNIPVYVSGITFGRILHFTMTSSASVESVQRVLNASYQGLEGGGSIDLSDEDKRILEEATIEVVTVGGDQEPALSVIRSGDLSGYFDRSAPLTSAVPISYEVHNLGDDSNAVFSETTSYTLKNCGRPAVRTLAANLSGSAKTSDNFFDCYGCRRWWGAEDTRTLPAGSYFLEDGDVRKTTYGSPSESACEIRGYEDFVEIAIEDGSDLRVPTTVRFAGSMRSPHGAGNVGNVSCDFEFAYVEQAK